MELSILKYELTWPCILGMELPSLDALLLCY